MFTYLVGYNQGQISDFMDMAKQMKKSINTVNVKRVGCSQVIRSSYCDGFSLATWNGITKLDAKTIKRLESEGWTIIPHGRMEYGWR